MKKNKFQWKQDDTYTIVLGLQRGLKFSAYTQGSENK